jgi:hypothetical protein
MKCKKGKQKCHNSGINFGKKNGNNILQLIVIYIIRKTYRAPPRILSRWNEDEHYLSRILELSLRGASAIATLAPCDRVHHSIWID